MSAHALGNRVPCCVPGSRHLLLSTPFYVYEELAWTDAVFRNHSMDELSRTFSKTKHFDDYFFMKSSLLHPMRTMDPSLAKIFVIPTLMNTYVSRVQYRSDELKLCFRNLCDKDLVETVIQTLRNSTWFQQYPERHIVVQSHYANGFRVPDELKAILSTVNAITFEDRVVNQQDRLRLPSTYVGTPCAIEHEKTLDVSMTATMKTRKTFLDRFNICRWITNSTSTSTFPGSRSAIRMSHCGHGQQCPALAQAKFGLHARGDTFGSNRLIDTILSGTVPIFTRREQYDILPSWLHWQRISVQILLNNVTEQSQFMKQLEDILQDAEGYKKRHDAVLQHRHFVDWNTLHPFDIYMYMLQAELYPETRHKTECWEHNYPALNLPPPVS
jgi:Exostosin family